jgi:hypothetical protein
MALKMSRTLTDAILSRRVARDVHFPVARPNIALLWIASLSVLAICAILLTWYPLLRIPSLPSINYNEGWNAYRQQMAADGQPLYATQPGLWVTNYPFLSFHLIAPFGSAIGSMVIAGRIVAFISVLVIAASVAGIVRVFTGSARAGIYAGLCFFVWVATLSPDRRGVNDPEFLGIAFASLGLLAYLRGPDSLRWTSVSALAFVLAMFTKHDVVALPICVGVELVFRRNWRALAAWIAVGAAAACCLLMLTYLIDGRYFLAHLLRPREYSFRRAVWFIRTYFLHFSPPLVVALIAVGLAREARTKRVIGLLLLVTNITAFLFAGGDGVDFNIFFVPLVAASIACGTAISCLEQYVHRSSMAVIFLAALLAVSALALSTLFYASTRSFLAMIPGVVLFAGAIAFTQRALPKLPWRSATLILGFAVPVVSGAEYTPGQVADDLRDLQQLPALTLAAQRSIATLRATDGPVICEHILLCFDAGKPLDYDPYFVKDQIMTGLLPEASILAILRSHRYRVVEMDAKADAARPSDPEPLRFTSGFVQALFADYHLMAANDVYLLFVPNK